MRRLTPEQASATRPEKSIFVSASAGTGKTYVLTARVLRMMVTGTQPDHILCLTYTKAAAAEMANRIYAVLGEWALSPEKTLAKKINAVTGEQADDEMLARARALFATVLDIPGGLKIQTIHSFCQSLLGRFPLEARLAPHFQVIDERTAAEFLREATETVMDQAGENGREDLKAALSQMARQTNEEGFQEVLTAFLNRRGDLLSLLKNFNGPDGLANAIYKDLGLDPSETRENILKKAFAPEILTEGKVKELLAALRAGTQTERGLAQSLEEFFKNRENFEVAFSHYCDVFCTKAGPPRATVLNQTNQEKYPHLVEFCGTETARLEEVKTRLALLKSAENTKSLIRLGTTILYLYQAEKGRFGFLDYDDLIFRTRDLLAREGIAPWILYKLDGGLDHILVDEAQDTNKIQWGMVEALSQEFFAGFGTRDEAIRTVFAVGDAKQSIYRFQGAEPGEFLEAKKRIRIRAEQAGLTFEACDLTKSFRSTRVVLDVVDKVFTSAEFADGLGDTEESIRHEAHRLGMSGLVEIWPAEVPEKSEQKSGGWQLPFAQIFTPSPEARLASKMAHHIEGLARKGEVLKARGRKIRFGDIMVLVQRRGPFMDYLIRELKSLNVPVAGSDRMVLSKQLVVEDLLALGKFALLPEDDFNLAVVLKGPLLNFNDEDLMDLAIGRKGTLWRAFSQKAKSNKKYAETLEFLKRILAMADFVTPFVFYSRILGPMGGRKAIAGRLGHEVGDPLDEFLTLAQDFRKTGTASLQGFLKWFAASETEVKRDMESGRDEVRIMTVHGAKGLEAPVVYLPDTFRTLRKRPATILETPSGLFVWPGSAENERGTLETARANLMAAEQAELNRLLYVAMTRAEDRLYVSGWRGQKEIKGPVWYDAILKAVTARKGVEKIQTPEGEIFRLETPQEASPVEDGEALPKPVGEVEVPGWAKKPAPSGEFGLEILQPSRAEGGLCVTPGEFSEDKEKAIRRGTIIHKLLEILPDLKKAKRQKVISSYLKAPAHGLDEKEQAKIQGQVTAVLEDPSFQALFSPGSRAELNIAGVIEGRLAAGQVDRVAITGKEVLIVDFKSNRVVPANFAEVPPAYIRQLQLYSGLLSEIYKGKKIRAALLWTETATLMEIPPDLLNSGPLDEDGVRP